MISTIAVITVMIISFTKVLFIVVFFFTQTSN